MCSSGGSSKSSSKSVTTKVDSPTSFNIGSSGTDNGIMPIAVSGANKNIRITATTTDHGAVNAAREISEEAIKANLSATNANLSFVSKLVDSLNANAARTTEFAKEVSIPLGVQETETLIKWGAGAAIAISIGLVAFKGKGL